MITKRENIIMEDDNEDEIMIDIEEDKVAHEDFRLTKHLSLVKEFPPLYTGGSFALLKNDRHCLAMRDS